MSKERQTKIYRKNKTQKVHSFSSVQRKNITTCVRNILIFFFENIDLLIYLRGRNCMLASSSCIGVCVKIDGGEDGCSFSDVREAEEEKGILSA
jgi:hypothetical protein